MRLRAARQSALDATLSKTRREKSAMSRMGRRGTYRVYDKVIKGKISDDEFYELMAGAKLPPEENFMQAMAEITNYLHSLEAYERRAMSSLRKTIKQLDSLRKQKCST